MKTKTKEVGNVTVLELKGKITIGEGDIRLREAIEELPDVATGAAEDC